MPQRPNSRPAFEVPIETGLEKAPVGWVYREENADAADWHQRSPANPIEMVATGLVLVGVGTVGVLSLAAFGLITAPLRLASIFCSRRL
jgi:hypothetical protein